MDVVLQCRIAAHRRSALDHGESADFHRSVSELFDTLDDKANATRARALERQHREQASREWELATLSLGRGRNARSRHSIAGNSTEGTTHD